MSFTPVEVLFASTAFDVREALSRFLAALQPLDLDPEESAAVELVLAEALNNIVKHAYDPTAQEGPIRLTGAHRDDGLHIGIVDQGQPMPGGKTPLGFPPTVDVDLLDLPEAGFGWFLIKDIAKDVAYVRADGENRLQLRVAVAVH